MIVGQTFNDSVEIERRRKMDVRLDMFLRRLAGPHCQAGHHTGEVTDAGR